MRHSRSEAFDTALSARGATGANRWTDLATDPNDARPLARRAETLRAAWRDSIDDRAEFLVDRCRGRRVLDIGCVAHDVARMQSPQWLHGRIAAVADVCLGVDVLDDGVAEMNRLGFRALSHDLTDGPGPIAAEGPFDVIVAGELIEHVGSIDMLFQAARDLLSASGELVITTPNPWAPARVRAGQRGDVWENVDHILFAFPSGVAELAERHGLVLAEAATTSVVRSGPGNPREALRTVRRRARGRQWLSVGFATQGTPRVVRVAPGLLRQLVGSLPRRDRRFVGGTFVYVVRRPSSDADPGR